LLSDETTNVATRSPFSTLSVGTTWPAGKDGTTQPKKVLVFVAEAMSMNINFGCKKDRGYDQ
jgi:hypothetical protein